VVTIHDYKETQVAPEDIKPTSIRLSDELTTQLDKMAKSLGDSRGWIITQACKLYIERRNTLPSVDWTVCDEAGSCGFGYRLDLHFAIPSMEDCDQVAYAFRDDIISRITAAGAREVWTEMQGIRPLEWEGNRFDDVATREVPDNFEKCATDGKVGKRTECRHGRPECECGSFQAELVVGELREWTPPPQTVNNYYTIDVAALDTETLIAEIKRRDSAVAKWSQSV